MSNTDTTSRLDIDTRVSNVNGNRHGTVTGTSGTRVWVLWDGSTEPVATYPYLIRRQG